MFQRSLVPPGPDHLPRSGPRSPGGRRKRAEGVCIRRVAIFVLLLGGLLGFPAASVAQEVPVFSPTQDLDFDRPDAWAMKYFTSASLLTGLGPVEPPEAGGVDLGLELIQIPHLDREERTVGFNGLKEEDLNRSPVWLRLRLSVGLGAGWGLTLGATPPVEVDGAEAGLWSLAIDRPLWRGDRGSLGLRLYGQTGKAKGDLTCAEGADETFPPGSEENPFGCRAPSNDEMTLEYVGLELVGGWRPGKGSDRAPTYHAGLALNHLDMEFQVDALIFDIRDRTLLRADGETVSVTAGATWDLGRPGRLAAEVFYTPLDVLRRGETDKENDALLNLRLGWRVRLR